jgi:TctA family transporter
VLGERIEVSFRRALTISNGDYSIFVHGPAARVFLGALGLIVVLQALAWAIGYRKGAAETAGERSA